MVEENNYPGETSSEVSSNLATPQNERSGKVFFVVLILLCLLALGWGGLRLNKKIHEPFPVYHGEDLNEEFTQILALQKQDTDNDGLSDYDELYVYNTSPYLEDSDSDGFTDAEEIASKHDPNCPSGQNCNWTQFSQQTHEGHTPSPLSRGDNSGLTAGDDFGTILQGSATATQLRQVLLSAGMSAEELNQLDDATLMEMYYQTLSGGEFNIQDTPIDNGVTNNTTDFGLTQEQLDYLNNLSADEIRALFKEMGLDEETLTALEQVDDDTLREMFMESLAEQVQ